MRWQYMAWAVAVALATPLVGCSSGGDDPAPEAAAGAAGASGAGGAGGSASVVPCDRKGELDLNGTWLIKARLDVVMTSVEGAPVAVCPIDQVGPAELLLVARVAQSGTELSSVAVTICDFSLPEVTAVLGKCDPEKKQSKVKSRVSASAALQAALPSLVVPKAKGKLGGTSDGASFEPGRLTFALGSQSLTGPMASWKGGPVCDDPKQGKGTGVGCEEECVTACTDVLDNDDDNFAGISMTVCGFFEDEAQGAKCNVDDPTIPGVTLQGTAGINFRVNPLLLGTAENSCVIRGNVDADIDYNVLATNIRLQGLALGVSQVRKAIPVFDVVPSTSQFVAARVDGQFGTPKLDMPTNDAKASCQAALANRNLF